MTLRKKITLILALLFSALIGAGSAALAASASPAAPLQPSMNGGVYSSLVHACVSVTHSNVGYIEENTDPGQIANCAAGYEQFSVNTPFLDPAGVSLTLGSTTYTCSPTFQNPSAQTGAGNPVEITALNCPTPVG